MLILAKKNNSRLAGQILKDFGTQIRKRFPHDMKPVLAKNTHLWHGLIRVNMLFEKTAPSIYLFIFKCLYKCPT